MNASTIPEPTSLTTTDAGYEERIFDAEQAAKEPSDDVADSPTKPVLDMAMSAIRASNAAMDGLNRILLTENICTARKIAVATLTEMREEMDPR